MTTGPKQPITLFLSYAQKDEACKQEFEDYLAILQHTQLISSWVERQVQPGTDWSQVIDPRLSTADFFVPLVSPALFASGYCFGAEVHEAFERSKAGKARVIPIILRSVDLTGHPFEKIVSLPRYLAVSSWPDQMAAWKNIDQELRAVIEAY
ncbi:MAG: toll/interleukin-1 receptor domain-containing protein [Ktedonobacteraceae bacterium]|nr:toll/interleukin-1 receptor domain-containing protein [Ktedonobacteraceae bacterium]